MTLNAPFFCRQKRDNICLATGQYLAEFQKPKIMCNDFNGLTCATSCAPVFSRASNAPLAGFSCIQMPCNIPRCRGAPCGYPRPRSWPEKTPLVKDRRATPFRGMEDAIVSHAIPPHPTNRPLFCFRVRVVALGNQDAFKRHYGSSFSPPFRLGSDSSAPHGFFLRCTTAYIHQWRTSPR